MSVVPCDNIRGASTHKVQWRAAAVMGGAQIQPPQEVGLAREVNFGINLTLKHAILVFCGWRRASADHVMNPLSHQTNSLATQISLECL